MPLLHDLRSMFGRRKGPARDLPRPGFGVTRAGDGPEGKSGDRTDLDLVEPKTAGRGQDDVMSLVERIGGHLDGQTERTTRLLTLMERLPQALDALPEINRQNARLVESLHEHLVQSKRREETLNTLLDTITGTSSRQTDVLGLVQHHLDTSSQATESLSGTLESLNTALAQISESSAGSARILKTVTETAERRESELFTTINRTQLWMIGAVCFCGAISIVAVVMAVLALTS